MAKTINSTIVVEDDISEAILIAIINHANPFIHVDGCLGKKGDQFIKQHINGFNNSARGYLYIILNDLDRSYDCAPEKLKDWLKTTPHNNLIFRIAVHEVESWILADRKGIASYLKIPHHTIPYHPDSLTDPKKELISLARQSRLSWVQDDILPPVGVNAERGRGYNSRLISFVNNIWDINRAIENSDSLKRTYNRISLYRPQQ